MALAKTNGNLLTSQSVAAGTAKGGVSGPSVNFAAYYGAVIGWTITNGSSAPGAALSLTFQQSPDGGTTWHDYQTVAGDTVVNSVNTGSFKVDRDVQMMRALPYGNTTNAVTAQADFTATTSL